MRKSQTVKVIKRRPSMRGVVFKRCMVACFAFIFMVSQLALSLSAQIEGHAVNVVATIVDNAGSPPIEPSSPPTQCQETEIIRLELVGNEFHFGDTNVVVEPGAGFLSLDDTVRITTSCDFTLQEGAGILVNGDDGGTIIVEAGGSVDIEGALEAKGSAGGGVQRGGVIQVVSEEGVVIGGEVNASAQDQGGVIEFITQGSFSLTSSGSLYAQGGEGGGTQRGGSVSIVARGGDALVEGTIGVYAQDKGGNVSITTAGNLVMSGAVRADGGMGSGTQTGGTVRFTTTQELLLSGTISATGEEGDGFIQTNYCENDFSGGLITPAPFEITSCSGILINEFIPNPDGLDNAPLPDGEWVELYNYATSTIDISGWILYDADDTHALPITTVNTNTGDTMIEPEGFLVVYRNGDSDFALNNSQGDSVRLFDGQIGSGGVLQDSITYSAGAASGKSFARVPDGGVWYDPQPTPGVSNVVENFSYFDDLEDVQGEALPEAQALGEQEQVEEQPEAQEEIVNRADEEEQTILPEETIEKIDTEVNELSHATSTADLTNDAQGAKEPQIGSGVSDEHDNGDEADTAPTDENIEDREAEKDEEEAEAEGLIFQETQEQQEQQGEEEEQEQEEDGGGMHEEHSDSIEEKPVIEEIEHLTGDTEEDDASDQEIAKEKETYEGIEEASENTPNGEERVIAEALQGGGEESNTAEALEAEHTDHAKNKDAQSEA